MAIHSLIPVHKLLTERDAATWSNYWQPLNDEDCAVTSQYCQAVAKLITRLHYDKIKRIFLIHKDRALFLAGFLAALQIGIPVILPPSDAPGLLKDLIQPEDGLLTDQAELLPLCNTTYVLHSLTDFNNFLEQPPLLFTDFDPLERSITFYTSGSTNTPKAIRKTVRQLETEIAALEKKWGTAALECQFFSTVPHHHIYGLLFSLLWPVCRGYRLQRQTFKCWEEIVPHLKASDYLISSPSHLGRMPDFENKDNLKLQYVFSSGGALSFEAAKATKQALGILPWEILGSTETGGIAYRQQHHSAQAWTRFEGVKLIKGENEQLYLQSSYLPDNSIYETQDRLEMLDEDHFHLLGRADQIVKIEGKRVCLSDIEQKLTASDLIHQAAVIPVDTPRRQQLGAIIVLSPAGQQQLLAQGKTYLLRELRTYLRDYFEAVVIPRRWRFMDMIPSNSQGKRPYHLLQAYFNPKEHK